MKICCRAPLKFLLSFQLHLLVHFWSFCSLSSRKILEDREQNTSILLSSFLFLVKVNLCLFLCPLLSSSQDRRAISSSVWLCLMLLLAREGCWKWKRDSKSQMSLGQWPADCQKDVAPFSPCTRGIKRMQSIDNLGQTSAEVVRQKKWLQCYSTDIGQAAGEMVKTQLS